jgi:hypothetical protein
MAGAFNIDVAFEVARQMVYTIINLPFQLWNMVPNWAKTSIMVFVFILSLLCIWLAIKYKDEWKYRMHY